MNTQRHSLAQAQARETECVLKRCLLSGMRLSFVQMPLGNFDRDRFCFGFEGRTKFYALALYGALAPLLQAVPPVS